MKNQNEHFAITVLCIIILITTVLCITILITIVLGPLIANTIMAFGITK